MKVTDREFHFFYCAVSRLKDLVDAPQPERVEWWTKLDGELQRIVSILSDRWVLLPKSGKSS